MICESFELPQIRKAPAKRFVSGTRPTALLRNIEDGVILHAAQCSDTFDAVGMLVGSPHNRPRTPYHSKVLTSRRYRRLHIGHSLRVGSVVSLAQAGASVVDMQVAGRWKFSQLMVHYAKAELAERGQSQDSKTASDK